MFSTLAALILCLPSGNPSDYEVKSRLILQDIQRPSAMSPSVPLVAGWRQRAKTLTHNSAVNRIRFSPDGKTLAAARKDSTITLWEVRERSEPLWQQVIRLIDGN